MSDTNSRFWRLSELLDRTTRDIRGRPVGHVADVIVDSAEGRLAYLHIRLDDTGGNTGTGITVPWSAISRIPDSQQDLRIAARKDTLLRLGTVRPPGSAT